jgi:hypothetical protein
MLKAHRAILGLALLLAMIGESSGQSPPEPPGQNPGGAQQRTNTEQRDTDQAPPSIMKPVGQTPAEHTQPKPTADEQKGPENRSNTWAISDKIAIIASAVALLQFFVLIGTVCIMMRTARRQLRAYVTIIGGSLITQEKTLHGILELKNAGQTPAYELTIWSQMKIQSSNETFVQDPRHPGHDDSALGKMIVGPGSTTNPRDRLEIPADSDVSLPAIRNGPALVYIWGRIDYRDAFRCKRFMEFTLRSHYDEAEKRFFFMAPQKGIAQISRTPACRRHLKREEAWQAFR